MPYICTRNQQMNGALVQLVRIRACHARGQGFESPTHRKSRSKGDSFVFFCARGTRSVGGGMAQVIIPNTNNHPRTKVVILLILTAQQLIIFLPSFYLPRPMYPTYQLPCQILPH